MMQERLRPFATIVCLIASFFHVGLVLAAECQKIGTVCLDTTPSKIIDGLTVTLADVGGCWQYEDTYECTDLSPGAINTCSQMQPYGCYDNTQSTCDNVAFNGVCLDWKVDYRCPDVLATVPVGVTFDRVIYEKTKDQLVDTCQPHISENNCVLTSQTCLEPGGIRNINGLDVYKDCWKWSKQYNCANPDVGGGCSTLASDPACTLKSTVCDSPNPTVPGGCSLVTKTYECVVSSTPDTVVTDCSGQKFCLDGTSMCFNTGYDPDQDFLKAVTTTEIIRQAGTYIDPSTLLVFNGTQDWCRSKIAFGLADCCDVDGQGAGQSNQNVLGQMAYSAVGSLVWEGVEYVGYSVGSLFGSYYVYDALFMSDLVPDWVVNGYGSITGLIGVGGGGYTFNPSFGAYGLSVTYGSVPATTLGTTNYVLTKTGSFIPAADALGTSGAASPASVGGFQFGFNPTMFAISIAAMVIMSYLACEQSEMELALKRGANLCHYVGSWCSNDTFFGCEEAKTGWCCFNSKLARIINEQGRLQIGKGWNTAQNPDCSGFTIEQMTLLDFGAMDLSEFYADVKSLAIDEVALKDLAKTHGQSISDTFETKYNDYFSK